jgi:hypothetical protein
MATRSPEEQRLMSISRTATATIETPASRHGSIAELRASLPDHALFHEIQVCGACDWATTMSVSKVLAGSASVLDSLSARRYGAKGELTIFRVRDLDDASLQGAVDEMRRLPGVRSVTVSHLLSAQRPSDRFGAMG